MLNVTGQRHKNRVGLILPEGFPVVRHEELFTHNSVVNQASLSGKGDGRVALVLEGANAGLYVAAGSDPNSGWVRISTVGSVAEDEFAVHEIDDMVDIQWDENFSQFFNVLEVGKRIPTKVVQTPVKLVDGSYAYRCRFTTTVHARPRQGDGSVPATLEMSFRLTGTTGDGTHNIIDNAVFQAFVDQGITAGNIDLSDATTNKVRVHLHTAGDWSGDFTFNISCEWTTTYNLNGGNGGE